MSQKSKFGYNQTTISGMLNEHPNMFILLRAVWNILQLNNMKVTYCCISQQGLFHHYFTDSDICSSSIHRIHYCTSMAIAITWKWQNVILYIQCLSCVMITNTHTVLSRPRCNTNTMDSIRKNTNPGKWWWPQAILLTQSAQNTALFIYNFTVYTCLLKTVKFFYVLECFKML
jgi:hypothetical protein